MRVAQFTQYGPPSVLTVNEVPVPAVRAGQALVRVHASSINPHDLIVRSGRLRLITGSKFPLGTGLDFAGVVEAVGPNVNGVAKGQRVWGVIPPTGKHKTGAAADYVSIDAQRLSTTPTNLTDLEAAALAVVGTTAFIALSDKLKLRKTDRLLIRGAAGGVGAAALQIAHAMGAKVTALVSSKDRELAHALGAEIVLDYREYKSSDLQRYDAILDCVGTELLRYRSLLSRGGRMVTVNFGSPAAMLAIASSVIFGSGRVRTFSASPARRELEAVAHYIHAGLLKADVGAVFPLGEIVAAHRSVEGSGRGKRVLDLSGAGC